MKELTQKERAKFRAVWDGNLEICASCIPQDPAPRIDSHGTPIWKRYYALIGLQAATVFGFRIAAKVVGTTVLGAILAAINIDAKFACWKAANLNGPGEPDIALLNMRRPATVSPAWTT